MADVQISTNESQEDLVSFFTGFNGLLEQLDYDADNFVTEYLGRKLETGNWKVLLTLLG